MESAGESEDFREGTDGVSSLFAYRFSNPFLPEEG